MYFCLVVDFKFKLNFTRRDPHRENVKFANLVRCATNIPDRIGFVFCLVVDFKFKLNFARRDPHRENVKFSEVLNLCSEIYKFSRI